MPARTDKPSGRPRSVRTGPPRGCRRRALAPEPPESRPARGPSPKTPSTRRDSSPTIISASSSSHQNGALPLNRWRIDGSSSHQCVGSSPARRGICRSRTCPAPLHSRTRAGANRPGDYKLAVKEFACVIDAQPTEVDGYRGRIEAQLLLGLYSDALRDYGRVTAPVLPVHPHAASTYPRRLRCATVRRALEYCGSHSRVASRTGGSSVTRQPHISLNHLLAEHPNHVYLTCFAAPATSSARATNAGVVYLYLAIALGPNPNSISSPPTLIRTSVSRAQRAFAEPRWP